jgi:hypothetical protein
MPDIIKNNQCEHNGSKWPKPQQITEYKVNEKQQSFTYLDLFF